MTDRDEILKALEGVIEERKVGQRLLFDVRFDAGEPDALVTDRVEDTIDYGEVCQVITYIAQQQSYRTLERLCAVIAKTCLESDGWDTALLVSDPVMAASFAFFGEFCVCEYAPAAITAAATARMMNRDMSGRLNYFDSADAGFCSLSANAARDLSSFGWITIRQYPLFGFAA